MLYCSVMLCYAMYVSGPPGPFVGFGSSQRGFSIGGLLVNIISKVIYVNFISYYYLKLLLLIYVKVHTMC